MSLFLNGLSGLSMRWTATWNGVWIAEVDLAPSSSSSPDVVPSGRVVITTANGSITLSGTVDPTFSAAFADRRRVRVLAGGGGWSKPVRHQHYHSESSLQLREVLSTTAAAVGEIVVLLEPKSLGQDYVRHDGAAGQVFADLSVDWWVGLDGATRVGKRPELPAPPTVRILDWNASAGTMSFSADALVEPGTILTDARFGRRIVRKVEATVGDATVTGTLYVAETAPKTGSVGEVYDAIASVARDATRIENSRFYEYFVDAMRGDQAELVTITKTMPNLVPASVWAGISGYKAKLRPGSRVMVGFREGDPKKPFIAFYEPPEGGGWRPAELDIDAVEKLTLGEVAAAVVLGVEATALPVARAPAIQAFAEAIATALTTVGSAQTLLGIAPVTAANLGGVLTGLGTAIKAAAAALRTAMPSAKVVSS